MRCINCGYVNEDNVSHCIKCHAELQQKSELQQNVVSGTQMQSPKSDFQPTKTVFESVAPEPETPRRKRPEPHQAKTEENAGQAHKSQVTHGTINVWENSDVEESVVKVEEPAEEPKCWLTNINKESGKEDSAAQVIDCTGESFELTRENTNPQDKTISSHQALLTHDADGWYIEDKSSFQSTVIVVTRRTKLQEGDVIALGTSRFVFTENNPQ